MSTASALEKYADERGIPLTDRERRLLRQPPRKGYVSRAVAPTLDSPVASGDVPWYYGDRIHPDFEKEAERLRAGREVKLRVEDVKEQVDDGLPPIVPRTAEERLNDMTKVLVDEYNRTGVIADSILREIQGTYWLNGENVTVESLRSVAAFYLNQATRMGQTTDPSVKSDIRTKER